MVTTLAENAQPSTTAAVDDEAELVRQAQQDLEAFTALYHRYVDRIYRYLLVRVGNVADAQDLTSQTFLAAMEGLPGYRSYHPFAAWLFGIARHKVADHFRRRRPEAALDTAVAVFDGGREPDELVGERLQMEQVARKLNTLSAGGLEVNEIGTIMHKQEPAVRMLIHRGLRDLQQQLQRETDE